MKYYAIYNTKTEELSKAQCRCLNAECINMEVSKEVYDNLEKYIYQDGELVLNPNYEQEQTQARQEQFNKDFFLTSLGYIRRKVTMKTGETKDFLSDLLPVISMGVQSGQAVTIIAYKEPDFTQDVTDWEALQEQKIVTPEFVQECFMRLSFDFTG